LIVVQDLLGVPFVDGGRDMQGLDCWGLFIEVMRRCGYPVPDYKVSCFDAAGIGTAYQEGIGAWQRVGSPSPGLAVAMAIHEKAPDMVQHFGVALDRRRFIHTLEKTGVIITKFSDPFFNRKIKGFYRWTSQSI